MKLRQDDVLYFNKFPFSMKSNKLISYRLNSFKKYLYLFLSLTNIFFTDRDDKYFLNSLNDEFDSISGWEKLKYTLSFTLMLCTNAAIGVS